MPIRAVSSGISRSSNQSRCSGVQSISFMPPRMPSTHDEGPKRVRTAVVEVLARQGRQLAIELIEGLAVLVADIVDEALAQHLLPVLIVRQQVQRQRGRLAPVGAGFEAMSPGLGQAILGLGDQFFPVRRALEGFRHLIVGNGRRQNLGQQLRSSLKACSLVFSMTDAGGGLKFMLTASNRVASLGSSHSLRVAPKPGAG